MRMVDVFLVFLRLGLTSFGGPTAHLGYFRAAFVQKRSWLSDAEYADLVALCQFLPGPASSQVGFAIGRRRAGLAGGVAAFIGFTAPSFLMMAGLALGLAAIDPATAAPLIAGLKIAAAAVVLHAVLGMAQSLCPDWTRRAFALAIGIALLFLHHPLAHLAAVAVGLAFGPLLVRAMPPGAQPASIRGGHGTALVCVILFAAGLFGLPWLAAHDPSGAVAVASACYRAGALVFGGGHVVLPLLERAMTEPGWMTQAQVLTGYAAAQARPGPLFAIAAYLGAAASAGPGGMAGALLATLALFAPGFLVFLAAEPYWARLRSNALAQRAVAGANAAVVGLLGAALIDPIGRAALPNAPSAVVALALFALLRFAKAPPLLVVALGAAAGYAMSLAPALS